MFDKEKFMEDFDERVVEVSNPDNSYVFYRQLVSDLLDRYVEVDQNGN